MDYQNHSHFLLIKCALVIMTLVRLGRGYLENLLCFTGSTYNFLRSNYCYFSEAGSLFYFVA